MPGPRWQAGFGSAAEAADAFDAIRNWIEQGYKQVKDELGWADFQVCRDIAIRRHQVLVNCTFSFCWATWFADHPPQHAAAAQPEPARGERGAARRHPAGGAVLAARAARGSRPAFPWTAL
jgi:hypothetical protein